LATGEAAVRSPQSLPASGSTARHLDPDQQLFLKYGSSIRDADHEFLKRLSGANARFSFDVDALPEPFPAPTLILTGRFDNWCGYQDAYAILESYPRATFAVLDCAGHALSVEQSRLFGALVGEWLDRVEAYAPLAERAA